MLKYLRETWDMTGERTKLVSVLVFFVSIVVFIALVWVLRNWRGESNIEHDGTPLVEEQQVSIREAIRAEEESGVVLPMSVAARSVLERHFAAIGGIQKISSISSFRMSGSVHFADGESIDVIIVKKSGNKMRITDKFPNGERVRVVSPNDNWVAYWQHGVLLRVEDMTEQERERQSHNTNVVSELWLSFQNSWDLQYIGQRDFNYKMTHVFEVQMNPRHSVRFMIDPDTFLDIGHEERNFEEDGRLQIVRRINSDHQEWNGLMVPGKIEVFVNDELTQTIHVKNIAVNPGILDSIFVRPKT